MRPVPGQRYQIRGCHGLACITVVDWGFFWTTIHYRIQEGAAWSASMYVSDERAFLAAATLVVSEDALKLYNAAMVRVDLAVAKAMGK